MDEKQRRIAFEEAIIKLTNIILPQLIREMALLRAAMDRMPRRPR